MRVLPRHQWLARQAAHQARVDDWTAGHRERAGRGEAHPVEDFLFTYYSHKPSRLRRWSPGFGVRLEDFDGPQPWNEAPPERAHGIVTLLDRTAGRAPLLGCFGLHEWAMVFQDEPRHREWPLRLGAEGTDAVVRELPVRCSHHDAFRFFTAPARSLNLLQPRRDDQADLEQGGCLHANMDLYKWAYKLSPWIAVELVGDCFELARRIRTVDMRASPYDFTALGLQPIAIETAAGRAAYVEAQRAFAVEAAVLRRRLADQARLLA
jgi:hypothetical protein